MYPRGMSDGKTSRGRMVAFAALGCAGVLGTCLVSFCLIGVFAPKPPPRKAEAAPEIEAVEVAPATLPTPAPIPQPACPLFDSRWGLIEGEHVGRDVMGDEWPLTVESGCLYCDQVSAVIFVHDGRTYGINGLPFPGRREVDPIWSDSPNPDWAGPKINIGPLLRRGLGVCCGRPPHLRPSWISCEAGRP